MGKGVKEKIARTRIRPTRQGGEWYAQIDPDTGAIKWLRRKVKKKKK